MEFFSADFPEGRRLLFAVDGEDESEYEVVERTKRDYEQGVLFRRVEDSEEIWLSLDQLNDLGEDIRMNLNHTVQRAVDRSDGQIEFPVNEIPDNPERFSDDPEPQTGWSKGSFTIVQKDGTDRKDGYVRGLWGVDKRSGNWYLTHLPSGMMLSKENLRKEACSIASEMDELFNRDGTVDNYLFAIRNRRV